MVKRVKSLSREFYLETSRDRTETFEPVILPKCQIIIAEELEGKGIALYSRGVSTRDISEYIKEIYQMNISVTQLLSITDKGLLCFMPRCSSYSSFNKGITYQVIQN